ncbi:S8 family serine peptidase [Thalassobacillus sp. CUG 92003]|uniref:S8 family serine peptidase n=1 Tax=Thalassobacillus sp. CUG 92003 TaxID=2736641 RepID=UPI003519EF17
MKKSLILFFIFLLAFSNSAFAASGIPNKNLGKSNAQKPQTKNVLKAEDNEKQYAPSDDVRVIVELQDEPALYSAQSMGKNYSELSESNQKKLRTEALDAQQQVKNKISQQSIPMDYKESFTTVVNGFSGTVKYKSIEVLESLPNVGKVHITHEYERPTEEPEMLYSKELVKAQQTWQDYGYKGEGMTVGVIDTGIDPGHQDMILSEETETEIGEQDVADLKAEGELPGKYFTEKVPYGYNYADENDTVKDLGPEASMHGMHVSGTVGANGDEDNGGIKGVAPEAQILGLKVFGNDPEMPSTYSDIYVKAIDDAIILGADVINMSLGSTASFVKPEDPEQKAVERAVDNGVMMSISAGNSAKLGEGFGNTFASNPDTGVVGAPGLSADSLQVAAFENEYLMLDAFNTQIDGEASDPVAFLSASDVSPESLGEGYHEVEYAGLGRKPGDSDANPEANDFEGVDVEGKIALIQRGESTFVSKTLNAQEEGAIGVIIFNNVSGYISMASSGEIDIPQLSTLNEPGAKLRDEIQAGNTVEISFQGEEVKSKNPDAGKMAGFSSWGTTPNLDFKPEITAPGSNILSTLQDDEYGMMSGTSMAAPHVSGGSALMMQRVDEEFSLEGRSRVEMSKNILMNTSVAEEDKGLYNDAYQTGLPYSPRLQGAGLMDLHAAMSTPVVATEKESGLGKVSLKEMDTQKSFTLELDNVSDESAIYNVAGTVQTDLVSGNENLGETQGVYKAGTISEEEPYAGEFPIEVSSSNGSEVENGYQVVVPANSSIEVDVSIDLSDAVTWFDERGLEETFENGNFVEGFVTFEDPNDSNPELSVPYVGFNGEWDEAPIVDDSIYDENGEPFYGQTGLVTPSGPVYNYLGVDPLLGEDETLTGNAYNVGFSPDGDGSREKAVPVLSFLRNAKDVEFNILNEDKEKLRTIRTQDEVRKHYFDGGAAPAFDIYAQSAWDGKVKGDVVEDGQYYYEIKSVVDYPDADWQSKTIPVKVDTEDPELDVSYDSSNGEVSWDAFDDGAGLSHFDVVVNGDSVLEEPLSAGTDSYTLENTEDASNVRVIAHDYAGNSETGSVTDGSDETVPSLRAITPEALSVTDNKDVQVAGYVEDDSEVTELTINGKQAELSWDSANQRYNFNETITFKSDGVKTIDFHASDDSGNDISFKRRVILDSSKPELSIDGPHITDQNQVDLGLNMKDNYDELRLRVDGSEVYKQIFTEPYEMRSSDKTYEHTVNLDEGKNTFEVEVEDLAGNTVTKQVTIYQSDEGPQKFDDVPNGFWGKEAIDKLNVAGVINGYPNGNFGVNDDITRVQAAQMIVRSLDLDTSDVENPGYSDVSPGDKGYKEIAAIAESGIMQGMPGGEFAPEGKLTRGQMAKIVVEAYGLEGSTTDRFKDVSNGYWAVDYVNTLKANHITNGYPDGTFKPKNNTLRAEFAMFVARAEDERLREE